jgi:Cof subfamily protein (haloacid dehalogenase superfamily)
LGITIVIATGRPAYGVKRIAGWLGLDGPLICTNGAHILSAIPRQDIRLMPIDREIALGVLDYLNENGFSFLLHLKNEYSFMAVSNPSTLPRSMPAFYLGPRGYLPKWEYKTINGDELKKDTPAIMKMAVMEPGHVLAKVREDLQGLYPGYLQYVSTSLDYMEIMNQSVNKGEALVYLAKTLGISTADVAAVGDGANDIEMLEMAGIGVAMSNCDPKAALAADRFTYSAAEDEAAEFIKEVIKAKAGSFSG